MSKKVYSRNEEEWYDLCEIMGQLEEDYEHGDKVEIQEGEAVPFKHREFIDAAKIIEIIQDWAFDEMGEWQQDYLDDLSNDKEKMKALDELLNLFISENAQQPKCFKVVNIKEIEVTVE
jgi:hypothetical protein